MQKRDLWLGAGAIALAIGLALLQLLPRSVPTGAWGLSYRTPGQTPVGPADRMQLEKYDAAYAGDPNEKVLYLTFDAGYENGYTAQILDTLRAHQVPAAFFLVGNYLKTQPDLVRQMVEDGHIVGNHTMHHPDMSKIQSPEAFEKELLQLEELFTSVTGQKMPKYYRPPQGVYSEKNLHMAQQLGYQTVFWSLAYADWDNQAQPSAQYAFDKLLPRVHNGAVILLHATSQTNAQILDELLTRLKAEGYTFESIDRLFC